MSRSPRSKQIHIMNVSQDQNKRKNKKTNMVITVNGKQLNQNNAIVPEDSNIQPISSSIRKLQQLSKPSTPTPSQHYPLSPRSPRAKNSARSSSAQRIPSPKSSKLPLIAQLQQMIKNLQKSKQKLKTIIQLYEIIDDNENSRCFQHANILSLYCTNQRKILCVNCLYGNQRHRCHKVMPLKDCMDRVSQDNIYISTIIQKQIQKLTESSRKCEQNMKYINEQISKKNKTLQQQYQQQKSQLESFYLQKRKNLHTLFSPIITKYQNINKLFIGFKDSLWKCKVMLTGGFGKEKGGKGKGKSSKGEDGGDQDVMKHVLGVSVLQIAADLEMGCRVISGRDIQAIARGRVVQEDNADKN